MLSWTPCMHWSQDPSRVEDRHVSINGIELQALELRDRDLEAEIDAMADAELERKLIFQSRSRRSRQRAPQADAEREAETHVRWEDEIADDRKWRAVLREERPSTVAQAIVGKRGVAHARDQQNEGGMVATHVFGTPVIYTPRGRSGGDTDVVKQYPAVHTRFPSLAQSAIDVEEAHRKHIEATKAQRALEAMAAIRSELKSEPVRLLGNTTSRSEDPDAD